MEQYVRCSLCGENIYIGDDCQCGLGLHLFQKHPSVNITHFAANQGKQEPIRGKPKRYQGRERRCYQRTIEDGFSRPVTQVTAHKTTVETWQPSMSYVACPYCKKIGKPFIRKQRDKVAYTALGHMCLFCFWPLCFLPLLTCGKSNIDIYCKYCSRLLGTYDRTRGRVLCPNKQKVADIRSLLGSR